MYVPRTQKLKEHIRCLIYQRVHDDHGDLTHHHGMDQRHGISVQDNLLYVFQRLFLIVRCPQHQSHRAAEVFVYEAVA